MALNMVLFENTVSIMRNSKHQNLNVDCFDELSFFVLMELYIDYCKSKLDFNVLYF